MGKPAFAIVIVAACGGTGGSTDVKPTLRFADLTDAQISRLVNAASGSEGFQAEGQLSQFDDPTLNDPCPNVVEDAGANTVSITGGCTTKDGTMLEGSADISNPAGWGDLQYNFNNDSVYTFSQLAFVNAGNRTSYDGRFVIGPSYDHLDLDVTTESLGVAVRSDIYMECSRTGCTFGASGVELVDVGGALVSGSISISGTTAGGAFTMRGVDTVSVTMKSNCVAWKLDGTDRGFSPCP